MSSLARSIPLVINGNPGIIKSIEHIYPASCTDGMLNSRMASLSSIAYIRHEADIEAAIFKNKVKWCLISLVLIRLPAPAAIKAKSISIGPPPSRNVNPQHARAAASPSFTGEYRVCICSISSRRL